MGIVRSAIAAGALLAVSLLMVPSEVAIAAVRPGDSDIDRDGKADIVVGAWGEPRGAVYVYYGDGSTQRVGGEILDSRARSVGFSVDTCDINADGFDDVVAGDPDYADGSQGQYSAAGAVFVFYGSATGLDHWSFVSQNSVGVPEASEAGDSLGWAVACGKTNGDGYDDVVAGAPFESLLSSGGKPVLHGTVTLFRGWSTGLVPAGSKLLHQNSSIVPGVIDVGLEENLGWAVELADVTGDGFADTLVGIPGELDGLGAVTMIRGSASGWAATGNTIVVGGASVGAIGLGISIADGNLNGSGPRDVAVGSYYCAAKDPAFACVPHSGAVTFLRGAAGGLTATGSRTLGRPSGSSVDQQFGYSIAAGDVTGDGIDELLVGEPGMQQGAQDTGEAWLFRGTTSGPTATGATRFNQNSPGVPDAIEQGDEFGSAVGLADRTGDGRAEAFIGAQSEDYYGTYQNSGVVTILRGTSSGLTGTGSVTVDASNWGGARSTNQYFGSAVAG